MILCFGDFQSAQTVGSIQGKNNNFKSKMKIIKHTGEHKTKSTPVLQILLTVYSVDQFQYNPDKYTL